MTYVEIWRYIKKKKKNLLDLPGRVGGAGLPPNIMVGETLN